MYLDRRIERDQWGLETGILLRCMGLAVVGGIVSDQAVYSVLIESQDKCLSDVGKLGLLCNHWVSGKI